MSTITKERVKDILNFGAGRIISPITDDEIRELARIALASLDVEPIYQLWDEGYYDTQKETYDAVLNAVGTGVRGRIVYTAPPAPANSDPVAWLWSHRKHPNEVSLVRPEDDERAEGAHWSGWSFQALYAAPPATVSVPDDVSGPLAHAYKELTPTFMRNHIGVFERYGIYPDGSAGIQAMRIALDGMNRRAAMLQGAENAESRCTIQTAPALDSLPKIAESRCSSPQVIPDCSCRTCRPVTMTDMRFVVCPDCGNKRCPHANDHRNACTGSNEPGQEGSAYPAAPRQEVE